ncbi:IS200/IS605 family transposase [Flavobacterium sp. Sd200]|uniref:IS200/IS605 family transposase n=1 Tax=Flavobacterium sp. Sd200 TaxID=2692211 RepID=UPI00136A33C8|nr:IS200/IS605 family transposase [Flavobacterium sp. Sd200]MXN92747.1 IS200/IS605 family transposase [Flavobacterium sp. Sd200]
MANTYYQIYIHIVFAVKGRDNLISTRWKEELYKYIAGILKNEGQKLIAINGMPNHVHILVGLQPTIALSNLVRDIKANSSRFINEKQWIAGKFEWQQGFGAFSCSHSQLTKVINYIQNQEEHHKVKTFREEYVEFLEAYNNDFKGEYIFEDV